MIFASRLGRYTVKKLFAAALATIALVSSIDVAAAQYGERVPISRNYRGEIACPTDYDIQDGWCVSIYSPNFRPRYQAAPPPVPRGYGYGSITRPWINRRGELQCPTDFVLDAARNCVSIYRSGY